MTFACQSNFISIYHNCRAALMDTGCTSFCIPCEHAYCFLMGCLLTALPTVKTEACSTGNSWPSIIRPRPVKSRWSLALPACVCLFPLSSSSSDPSFAVPAAVSGWPPQRLAVPSGRRDVAGAVQSGVRCHNQHAARAESSGGDGSQSFARSPEPDGHGPCAAAGESRCQSSPPPTALAPPSFSVIQIGNI